MPVPTETQQAYIAWLQEEEARLVHEIEQIKAELARLREEMRQSDGEIPEQGQRSCRH